MQLSPEWEFAYLDFTFVVRGRIIPPATLLITVQTTEQSWLCVCSSLGMYYLWAFMEGTVPITIARLYHLHSPIELCSAHHCVTIPVQVFSINTLKRIEPTVSTKVEVTSCFSLPWPVGWQSSGGKCIEPPATDTREADRDSNRLWLHTAACFLIVAFYCSYLIFLNCFLQSLMVSPHL